ncbi:MAG: DMT family transporter, partial [Planctomycetota bacterium]
SVVLLREPVVRRDLIPLCFGALGVGTILFFEIRGVSEIRGRHLAGVACGLVSGVTYAGVLLFLRRLRRENGTWLIGLNHAVVVLLMLPWVIWMGIWPSWSQLGLLAILGVFQMGIPYVCMTRALRTISPQEAVAIALLEPVLNPLWVFLFGLEMPRWWTIAGASLILVGLVLRYVVFEGVLKGLRRGGGR